MEVFNFFLAAICCSTYALTVLIHAQDQSGFISIDCGIPEGSSYTDNITGINYVSDVDFIDTGVNANISPGINTLLNKQYHNLRSFPDGVKSCYILKPAQGKNNKYLIRAAFVYGNYDNKSDVPRFDLYLGVNWWATVSLQDLSQAFYCEIIHVPQSGNIEICLVNTGFGTPFISFLELRLLDNNSYVTESAGSLLLFDRYDYGSSSSHETRFPNDVYDRLWSSWNDNSYEILDASSTIQSLDSNYRVPSYIMETAEAPVDASDSIQIQLFRDDPNTQFFIYMYFAEIQELEANQIREFDIYRNGELWYGPVSPKYLQTTAIYRNSTTRDDSFYITISKTANSNLPPLLNAFEVYYLAEFLQSETNEQDVNAIMSIRSTYNVKKHWKGDPCRPQISIWEGLNCSFNDHDPPRIISLNLSSSELNGQIAASISKLTMLEYLDLSNNSLTGPIPSFLSQLQFLRVLNLADNELSGLVPQELIERSKNGSLSLNVRQNQHICSSFLCKRKSIVPLISVICAISILLIALAILWRLKRRKQVSKCAECIPTHNGAPKERRFAYSEVLNVTNNLECVVGKGKSGTVYLGLLDDTPVAVKIFSQSYIHEYKQFQPDAKLVTRVHHRHLTSNFGYFEEGYEMGLIYEFMANGSLEDIASGKHGILLSWLERLHIALDVAKGLDYLHNGCKPPIIHGNLKPTNILLNENYLAKLVDFGLSNIFTIQGCTKEYLDPEYYVTNKFTKRSDVFSFGVALLQIITSKLAITNSDERTHINQWVGSLIGKGDIKSVVDSRLKDEFHIDSAWKVVELAMACVSLMSKQRPTISQVVLELNQCLDMEMARISKSGVVVELVTVNMDAELAPQAR